MTDELLELEDGKSEPKPIDRIVMIRSVNHKSGMVLRGGLCYRLPLSVSEELLASGMAYREGDEPPFAEEDLKRFAQVQQSQDDISAKTAALRAKREREKQEEKQRALDAAKKAERQAAALQAARAARKGGR